jgi:hypothetical protein
MEDDLNKKIKIKDDLKKLEDELKKLEDDLNFFEKLE